MKLLIKNATVIDGIGDKPLLEYNVTVEGNRIAGLDARALPAEQFDKVIDASGRTLIPGIMNSHVHLVLKGDCGESARDEMASQDTATLALRGLANAQKMLRHGVTTLRDMGAKSFEVILLRNAINAGVVDGPRIQAAGQGLIMTGGPFLGCEADGADGVRQAARRQLKAGADWIKLFATMGSMNPVGRMFGGLFGAPTFTVDEMKAAVAVGRAAGRGVAAHALGREGIINALAAGVTSLEHGLMADNEAIAMMRDKGVYLIPTIGRLDNIAKYGKEAGLFSSTVERYAWMREKQMAALHEAHRRGVQIAFGTDGGSTLMPYEEVVSEAKCMQEAGMSPMEIIRSMTSTSAALLGLNQELGSIEKGKLADLVLLAGNPLEELENLDKVSVVIFGGRIVASDTGPATCARHFSGSSFCC